jgi:kynurenine formamidase
MTIQFSEIIDLSHPITEDMPHWPDDPLTKITAHTTVAQDGYRLNSVTIGEHTGTHIGAPSHFDEKGWSIDEIEASRLVAPAITLNIVKKTEIDRDYLLTLADVNEWEAQYGHINEHNVVLVQTGWSRFWNSENYFHADESGLHFPGISVNAAKFLIRERHIIGLGIDTAGIDGGQSTDFAANVLLAQHNIYHLENLNLRTLSTSRLTIAIGALPIQNGSGSPCRVFGFI